MRENLVREELEDGQEETQPRADRRPSATDRSGNRQRKTYPTGVPRSRIKEQGYYRWRKEYGGLKLEQARRLKELEKENSRLRRPVTELSLEKQVSKDVASGNF
jgi:putative transposase